jgi:hypothetical protein
MKQIPAATNGSIFAAATADQLKGEPEHRVRCWLREGRPLRDSRFAGYGLALASSPPSPLGRDLSGTKWP